MNIHLLLSILMVIVGVVFLILSFVFPSEIKIGACIASLILAAIFYFQHKKQSEPIRSNSK